MSSLMSFFSRLLEQVFGCDFLPLENLDVSGGIGPIIGAINTRLQQSVNNNQATKFSGQEAGKTFKTEIKVDHGDGRVGNERVSLDIVELPNRILSYDTFKIIGVRHFGTVKTNCGVYRGKWQYEVLLLSSGVMQIGWVTSSSKFELGQGVGDTSDSYAFDGSRICKWNISAEHYGEKWEEDDVIGCCIDLDDGLVEFYRNGTTMGVAYKDLQMGAGIAYFPAVSLQHKEGVVANFGSSPLSYPVPGYQPIQGPPKEENASVVQLLDYISKLLTLIDSRATAPDLFSEVNMSYEALLLEIGKVLVLNITPHLKIPYLVETKLIPFIRGLCESENLSAVQGHVRPSARAMASRMTAAVHHSRKLNIFLDLLWLFSEETELKAWATVLVSRLSVKFQHNMRPYVLEFTPQKDAIWILHCLMRHKIWRHYLMNQILFDGIKFPWFMNIKVPPIESYTFWETEPAIKMNKRAYMASLNRITTAMNGLEEMQNDLLLTMMDNTDGSEREPSTRSIFLIKFRTLRKQFYALYRVNPLRSAGSPLLLVWPFFLRLLRLFETLWGREMESLSPDVVPATKFYDGSIPYYDVDRLGGVLLYLLKTFHKDLEQRLGASGYSQLNTQNVANENVRPVSESSTSTVRNITGSVDLTNLSTRFFDLFEDIINMEPSNNCDEVHRTEEAVDSPNFLIQLLDSLILFYHISTKTFPLNQNIILLERKVIEISQSLSAIKGAMEAIHSSASARNEPALQRCMELSYSVLLGHLNKATSYLTTLHATTYADRHTWLFRVILNTMKTSAEDAHLFNFVPEFYLECLADILQVVSTEGKSDILLPEDNTVADHGQLLLELVQFICDHIDDQRVRIAKAKDIFLSTLLEIVTTPNLVEALHNIPADSQMNMVRFLLQPYEKRAWANSNWILVRIWHGSPDSFASAGQSFQYHAYKLKPKPLTYPTNPFKFDCDPYPSRIFQQHVQNLLINEPDVASSFLNSVLNEMNWAFSEFIGMLQELQNAANRQERVLVESRQLKICATCFDLTVALLRVLEMVSSLAFPIFVRLDQPNSCFLLARVCQVLNRTSSQDGCFHHIISLEVPGLENLDNFPILTAVCGILLALLKKDMETFNDCPDDTVPIVTKTLLMEPSFQISSLVFLLDESPHLYSLPYYKEFLSSEDILKVEEMLSMLTYYHRITTDANTASGTIAEDDMCTICFAYPLSATFEPCKHHSCQACITHHLMNCNNCFFCKSTITKVLDDKGKVILDVEQEKLPSDSAASGN